MHGSRSAQRCPRVVSDGVLAHRAPMCVCVCLFRVVGQTQSACVWGCGAHTRTEGWAWWQVYVLWHRSLCVSWRGCEAHAGPVSVPGVGVGALLHLSPSSR